MAEEYSIIVESNYSLFLKFLMFIYFWGGGRVREREREREGDTESKAGSMFWVVSTDPNTGLELTNREDMTWAEVGSLIDWATQVHYIIIIEPDL